MPNDREYPQRARALRVDDRSSFAGSLGPDARRVSVLVTREVSRLPGSSPRKNRPFPAGFSRADARTYGHLAPDAEEYERGLLDAFDKNNATEAAGCRPL
jgi:hypothetical protein